MLIKFLFKNVKYKIYACIKIKKKKLFPNAAETGNIIVYTNIKVISDLTKNSSKGLCGQNPDEESPTQQGRWIRQRTEHVLEGGLLQEAGFLGWTEGPGKYTNIHEKTLRL